MSALDNLKDVANSFASMDPDTKEILLKTMSAPPIYGYNPISTYPNADTVEVLTRYATQEFNSKTYRRPWYYNAAGDVVRMGQWVEV